MTIYDDLDTQHAIAAEALAKMTPLITAANADNLQDGATIASLETQLADANARIADLEAQVTDGLKPAPAPEPAPNPLPDYTILPKGADLQAAVNKQTPVKLQGEWLLNRSLTIPPAGAKIYLDQGARLVKNWSGSGATRNALIVNADWSRPIAALDIRGPGKIEANPGMRGNMFGVWADNIYFRNFKADYFLGGRYFMGGGKNMDVANLRIRCDMSASAGSGGWRVSHGSGIVKNCDIWSGDDVYQCVPAGATADPLFNKGDIDGFTYVDCIGRSLAARMMVAGLQAGTDADGNTSAGMKSGVHNVTFTRVTGFGGGSAVNIAQHNSTGSLDHFTFTDCVVDQRLAGVATNDPSHGQPGEVYALAVAGCGPVDYLNFGGLTILNKRSMKDLFYKKGPLGSHITAPKLGTGSLPDPVK
jgi:hypothetical protein